MKPTAIFLSVTLFTGCAASGPIIDPYHNKPPEVYEQDLSQCKTITDAYAAEAATYTVAGAGLGAGIFALTGALLGVNNLGQMAALGAGLGGLKGLGESAQDKQIMMARCMQGRGYSVLR